MMAKDAREGRYMRIYEQIKELIIKCEDPTARMATIVAILKSKQLHFFWCGFYFLRNENLIVGPYQGPLACMKLGYGIGVCWACANSWKSIIVDDVEQFPGHIACDSRSKSEIVIPVFEKGNLIAVMDVDSDKLGSFNEVDKEWLEKIVELIYI